MNESILVYRRLLFLKLALVVAAASVLAYGLHNPVGIPSGGTWLGYVLGGAGALLILWLMWFGVRKRRYGPGRVKLEAWLSAHVYLGLSLLVVATLHTGFQFGWNVHTLAYGLMLAVIASGIFGLYAYIRYPRLMTENRRGVTLQAMLGQIAEIDRECREVAITLGEEVNRTVMQAAEETRIGGGALRQLSGRDRNCPTAAALRRIEALAGSETRAGSEIQAGSESGESGAYRRLVDLLARKDEVLRRARRDVQFNALMQVWLFLHVPLSFALLATLTIHVFAVFFYW